MLRMRLGRTLGLGTWFIIGGFLFFSGVCEAVYQPYVSGTQHFILGTDSDPAPKAGIGQEATHGNFPANTMNYPNGCPYIVTTTHAEMCADDYYNNYGSGMWYACYAQSCQYYWNITPPGTPGGCSAGHHKANWIAYDCDTSPPSASTNDYDGDGIPDSADNYPGQPDDQGKNAGRRDELCHIFVKNPANVATGNKYEEVLDLSISTPGIPLEFRRSYNSQVLSDGPLGYGWTHSFDLLVQVVQENAPKRVIVWDSDGRALSFTEISRTTDEITFSGESGVKDRLKQVISTG